LRTASRATARCRAEPNDLCKPLSASCGRFLSIRPMANFTRSIRVTASSMRDIGTLPSSTSSFNVSKKAR